MTTTQTTSPTRATATCVLTPGPITDLDIWHVQRFREFLADRKRILDSYAYQLAELPPDDPKALMLRGERRRVVEQLLTDYSTDTDEKNRATARQADEHAAPASTARTAPFTREMALGMSEATLQTNVLSLAAVTLDYLGYHTHDSRRSQPGFPDLVLVSRRQRRLLFVELKTERGRQSINQVQWEREIREAGHGEYYLWRPTDWLNGSIARILQRRPATQAAMP